MVRHRWFPLIGLSLALAASARVQDDPEAGAEGRERYLGREIARTMHWTGAAWLLRETRENEENGETSTFGGSITQALTMMNGPLLGAALSDKPGTVLHQVLSARTDDEEKIRRLCRAALSRDPLPAELSQFRRIIGQAKSARKDDPRSAVNDALRDVYWAYLNSSEFVTIR